VSRLYYEVVSELLLDPIAYERQQFYGDESARLAEFRALTPEAFKEELVATHDRIMGPGPYGSEDFYAGDRTTHRVVTPIYRFPHAADRGRLLTYGLRQAQKHEDIQHAAITEGVTIMATHPFHDRVGGLVRAQYMYRSRGWNAEQQVASGLVKPHTLSETDAASREYIDFGAAFGDETTGIPQLIDDSIYKEKRIFKIADSISCARPGSSLDSASSWRESDFRYLNQDEVRQLKTLLNIGGSHYIPSGQPARGLLYALSCVATMEKFDPYVQEGRKIYLFDALASLSGPTKRTFITKAWEYYTLHAQACIDLTASDELLPPVHPYGPISQADFVAMHTRNFRAQRQPLHVDGLLPKPSY